MVRCHAARNRSKKDLAVHDYYCVMSDVLEHGAVQSLKAFHHHVHTTRFQHSLNVSYYSYAICRWFRWDAVSAARTGMLYDLYFYETCDYDHTAAPNGASHLAFHPQLALSNAAAYFSLNEKETDMIVHYMWPFVRHKPQSQRGICDCGCGQMGGCDGILRALCAVASLCILRTEKRELAVCRLRGDADISTAPDLDNANGNMDCTCEHTVWYAFLWMQLWKKWEDFDEIIQ